MVVLKCKMCGGDIEVNENMTLGTCMYCGSTMTVPRIDNEKKARLFNHANQYRLNNEFDKAYDAYKAIVDEDEQEAEAYWGLVLSEYGVEYVEDPKTKKRIPTCHRTRVQAIQNSTNYELACKYADAESRFMYQDEAEVLDQLQKKIISISAKEEPYDVFICYKETDDENGERTEDSVLAQDIYNELTKQGIRTFFARISLEDKLGQSYEPYIYAALQSSNVMLHVSTASENSNAIWVKNEWKRYIDFMAEDDNKTLIPVYKDMSPYELPAELTRYQAQDMSKVGAIQDLVHGVQKLVKRKVNGGTTGLKKDEKDILNKLEKNQKSTKLIITSALVLFVTFCAVSFLFESRMFSKLFYSPSGWIFVYDIPGPKIMDLPILFLVVPLLYDIAIICNIMRGLKSQIAHAVYCSVFFIVTIALSILQLNRIKGTNIVWKIYFIVVLVSLASSVITYLRSKKRLFALLSMSMICVAIIFGAFLLTPSQSNERDTSVDQIMINVERLQVWNRAKANVIKKQIEYVEKNDVYTVLERNANKQYMWFKIKLQNGVTGYVHTTDMNNIKFMPAGNENAKQSNERNTAVNQIRITTEYINLRMSPSSKTEIIGKVFEDEVYTVLEIVKTEEYIWYKIRTTFDDEGYVASGLRNDYVEYLQAE